MKNRIKILRATYNLTQSQLAKNVGVSLFTINALEANKYSCSVGLAFKLAKYFKTRVDEIFVPEEKDYEDVIGEAIEP